MNRHTFFAVLTLAAALGAGCHSPDTAPSEPQPRRVRVAVAQARSRSTARSFAGVARAASEAKLSFKVPGTLSNVGVRVGDRVAKGQRLASLDATDLDLKRGEANAALRQAKAQLRNAEAQHRRVATLYENDSASRQDLDAARLGLDSARANLQAAEQRNQLAEARVAYAQLIAPSAGRVAEVSAEAGENLREGKPVVTLNTGDSIEVEISVPESVIAQVRSGDAAQVSFAAVGEESFSATVTQVGVSVANRGAAYPVVLQLDRADPRILSGMAARARLELSSSAAAGLVVPSKAVGEDRSGRFAWVAVPEQGEVSVAQRRRVATAGLTDEGLVVTEGLKAGDLVITAGLTYLEENLRVRAPRTDAPSPLAPPRGAEAGGEAPRP